MDLSVFFQFEIRAASSIYGVTSVSIVDWNKGILSDLSSIISSGDEQEETVTNEDDDTGPGYTVVEDGLPGDTYPEEYSMDNQIQGNSFGFHIVKGHCLFWYNILFCIGIINHEGGICNWQRGFICLHNN